MSTLTPLQLQSELLQAINGLVQLMAQLSQQNPSTPETADPGVSALWDELSVVELRALLRSYPIDRTSLPAPIELLRRNELIEALNQIQALGS
jgi:hypothetical protein